MTEKSPCTRFFSTNGCPYGSTCNFQHYIPRKNTSPKTRPAVPRSPASPEPEDSHEHPEPDPINENGYKTRLCYRYSTPEGCRYGRHCFFAHGEEELREVEVPKASAGSSVSSAVVIQGSSYGSFMIKTSAVGAVIGKSGCNVKEICQVTGVKLHIRDVESDTSVRKVEIFGSVERSVEAASAMVKKLAEQTSV